MFDQPRTRQELYDRIRQEAPADEVRRQGEIRRELEQWRQENTRLFNEKKLRQEFSSKD